MKKQQTHETQEKTESKDNTTHSMQEPEGIASIEEITFENDEDNIEDYNYDMYNLSDVFANDKRFPITVSNKTVRVLVTFTKIVLLC